MAKMGINGLTMLNKPLLQFHPSVQRKWRDEAAVGGIADMDLRLNQC